MSGTFVGEMKSLIRLIVYLLHISSRLLNSFSYVKFVVMIYLIFQ